MHKSIAFVCGGIGDQLYHFTQMQALAQRDHRGQIDIACLHPAIMSKIVQRCSWAGEIFDLSGARRLSQPRAFLRFMRQIAARQYSHSYILHTSSSFKLACQLARIPHRIGLAGHAADRLMLSRPLELDAGGARRSDWGHRPFIAAIDAYLESTLETGQYQALSAHTPIRPNDHDLKQQERYQHLPRPWIVANLFAQDEARRWPVGHALRCFGQLADRLGGTIFLNAGADAANWHSEVIRQWTGTGQIIHTFDDYSDIHQDIALYHLADIYLGVDSFTANLALNCDVKSVILFNKQADVLNYRSEVRPIYPGPGEVISDLPVNHICDEVEMLAGGYIAARQK
ncbi:MAG: glycosyltransferase family 9 protein [Candidatus Puniceispirillaceae bacterium]